MFSTKFEAVKLRDLAARGRSLTGNGERDALRPRLLSLLRLIITSSTVEFDCIFLKKEKRIGAIFLREKKHLHGLLILSSARRGRAVDAAEEDNDFLGDLKMAA